MNFNIDKIKSYLDSAGIESSKKHIFEMLIAAAYEAEANEILKNKCSIY